MCEGPYYEQGWQSNSELRSSQGLTAIRGLFEGLLEGSIVWKYDCLAHFHNKLWVKARHAWRGNSDFKHMNPRNAKISEAEELTDVEIVDRLSEPEHLRPREACDLILRLFAVEFDPLEFISVGAVRLKELEKAEGGYALPRG